MSSDNAKQYFWSGHYQIVEIKQFIKMMISAEILSILIITVHSVALRKPTLNTSCTNQFNYLVAKSLKSASILIKLKIKYNYRSSNWMKSVQTRVTIGWGRGFRVRILNQYQPNLLRFHPICTSNNYHPIKKDKIYRMIWRLISKRTVKSITKIEQWM